MKFVSKIEICVKNCIEQDYRLGREVSVWVMSKIEICVKNCIEQDYRLGREVSVLVMSKSVASTLFGNVMYKNS